MATPVEYDVGPANGAAFNFYSNGTSHGQPSGTQLNGHNDTFVFEGSAILSNFDPTDNTLNTIGGQATGPVYYDDADQVVVNVTDPVDHAEIAYNGGTITVNFDGSFTWAELDALGWY